MDDNGDVWVGNAGIYTTVSHARNDGTFVGLVDLGCGNDGATGVSVDSNGKIWAACINRPHRRLRIDPKRVSRMLNDVLNPAGYLLGDVTGLGLELDTRVNKRRNLIITVT